MVKDSLGDLTQTKTLNYEFSHLYMKQTGKIQTKMLMILYLPTDYGKLIRVSVFYCLLWLGLN